MKVLIFDNSKDPVKDRFLHEISKTPRLSPKFILEHDLFSIADHEKHDRLESDCFFCIRPGGSGPGPLPQGLPGRHTGDHGPFGLERRDGVNGAVHISQFNNQCKAAEQMRETIATILNTGRMQSKEKKIDIDLNQVITDQVELLKSNSFFKHHMKAEMDLRTLPAYRGIISGKGNHVFSRLPMKNGPDSSHHTLKS